MVTPDGTIVSDEAYIVLREFFFDPQANISAMEISNRTFMDPFQVRSLCRQLATHRIIEESPAFSTRFQVAHAKLTARVLERLASQFRPVWKEAA